MSDHRLFLDPRALRSLRLYKELQLLLAVLDLVRSETLISLLVALPLSGFSLGGFPLVINCLLFDGLKLSALSNQTTLGSASAPPTTAGFSLSCFMLGSLDLSAGLGSCFDPAAVRLPDPLEILPFPLRGSSSRRRSERVHRVRQGPLLRFG